MNIVKDIKPKTTNPVEELLAMAANDMAVVDKIILKRMQSPVGIIPDLAGHLVGAGGKRLRPLLTIAAAHLCEYEGEHHYKLAAAVEFIHSATLLHDDVVDTSDKRRGKKAANLIWGNAPSILVGDFLFSRAFNLMVETKSLGALETLSNAASIIAEGEVRQLALIGDINMDYEDYMSVIGAKTAALFSAAAEVSPILAASDKEKQKALKTYGQELGLAFQLVDDVLDYGGIAKNLGKNIGDDFREGKMTLPVIIAYKQALQKQDKMAVDFWQRVISNKKQNPDDLARAINLLQKYGALTKTLEVAAEHIKTAKLSLDIFADNKWKTALADLADFVIERVN